MRYLLFFQIGFFDLTGKAIMLKAADLIEVCRLYYIFINTDMVILSNGQFFDRKRPSLMPSIETCLFINDVILSYLGRMG